MRRSLIILVAVAVAFVGVRGLMAWQDNKDRSEPRANASGLPAREVSAGAVDVKIQPLQLDDRGAAFKITLDTHSVELDAELTQATLDVGGRAWPVDGWSGDGPGGHHREGELRFQPAGAAGGTATLTIPELPEPVEASWEFDG